MSDTLRDGLLEALLNLVVSLELSDEELVDAQYVSDVLGDVVSDLDRLDDTDRDLLIELIRHRAAGERDPERREVLLDAPEDLGLLPDVD